MARKKRKPNIRGSHAPFKSKVVKRAASRAPHPGSFKPGNPGGPGRQVGSVNKITADLKKGIIEAAVKRGSDGKGKDGLVGYLFWLARLEPRSFASLLGRLVPMHIIADEDPNTTMTREEVEAKLLARGLPLTPIFAIPVSVVQQAQQAAARQPKPFNPGDDAKPIEPYEAPSDNRQPVASRFVGLAPPRAAAVIDHKPSEEE